MGIIDDLKRNQEAKSKRQAEELVKSGCFKEFFIGIIGIAIAFGIIGGLFSLHPVAGVIGIIALLWIMFSNN